LSRGKGAPDQGETSTRGHIDKYVIWEGKGTQAGLKSKKSAKRTMSSKPQRPESLGRAQREIWDRNVSRRRESSTCSSGRGTVGLQKKDIQGGKENLRHKIQNEIGAAKK